MADTLNLLDIFTSVSKQMKADFEQSRIALSHPTLKGDAAEEIVRNFLKKYLPSNLGVSRGLVVDSTGRFSKQQDVIIYDYNKTPILYENADTQVIPIETVYAVIEVKSILKKQMVESIFENMNSIKKLIKSAYYRNKTFQTQIQMYGNIWSEYQVNYFIFAFDIDDPVGICTEIIKENNSRVLPMHKRIDSICVLDKYVFLNAIMDENNSVEKVDALPKEGYGFYLYPTENALLLFYTMISNYLFQAHCDPIILKNYLGNMTL